MTEEKLQKLKEYYTDQAIPDEQVTRHWEELAGRLPDRQYHPQHYTLRYAAAFLTLILFFGSGMIVIQAAAPNTPLYPVKAFSERTAAKLSGQYDTLIQNRTTEIINAAQKKSDEEIREATEEYRKALLEAGSENRSAEAEKNASLKETLSESETKLRTVTPVSKKAQSLIKQSIQQTQQTRKDVKSAHTENTPSEQKGNSGENKTEPENKPASPGNSGNTQNSGNNGNAGGNSEEHRKNQ